MKILPLSTQDLVSLLKSGLNYENLLPKFKKALQNDEKWGSKWYEIQIKAMIREL